MLDQDDMLDNAVVLPTMSDAADDFLVAHGLPLQPSPARTASSSPSSSSSVSGLSTTVVSALQQQVEEATTTSPLAMDLAVDSLLALVAARVQCCVEAMEPNSAPLLELQSQLNSTLAQELSVGAQVASR